MAQTLTLQEITDQGKTIALVNPEETSLNFTNSGREFIMVKLASGDFETVTITVTAQVTAVDSPTYGNLTKSNATDTVSQGQTVFIGPFPVGAFSNAEGTCSFSLSAVSGISIGVFQFNY